MKNKFYTAIFMMLSCFTISGCTSKKAEEASNQSLQRVFVTPQIPTMITNQAEKQRYMTMHYFDLFDFKDTTSIPIKLFAEKGIVSYLATFRHIEPDVRDSSLASVFRKAAVEPKMYSFFWDTMSKYLNDPNSPIRNEDFYISVCRAIVNTPTVDAVISSNAAFNLQQALKNRPGDIAKDFKITLESKKIIRMSDIRTPYTLIFFYEPDCPNCKDTKQFLRESPLVNNLILQKTISLLAFYPQDDKAQWTKWLSECSPNWINGYDPEATFTTQQPYDLRAFPTFYLLDQNKKVVLKDESIETILMFLQQGGQKANSGLLRPHQQ